MSKLQINRFIFGFNIVPVGAETGIRTRGTFPYTAVPRLHDRPLRHLCILNLLWKIVILHLFRAVATKRRPRSVKKVRQGTATQGCSTAPTSLHIILNCKHSVNNFCGERSPQSVAPGPSRKSVKEQPHGAVLPLRHLCI